MNVGFWMNAYNKYTPIVLNMLGRLMMRLRVARAQFLFVRNFKRWFSIEKGILYRRRFVEYYLQFAWGFFVINYFIRWRIHVALFNYNSL